MSSTPKKCWKCKIEVLIPQLAKTKEGMKPFCKKCHKLQIKWWEQK